MVDSRLKNRKVSPSLKHHTKCSSSAFKGGLPSKGLSFKGALKYHDLKKRVSKKFWTRDKRRFQRETAYSDNMVPYSNLYRL